MINVHISWSLCVSLFIRVGLYQRYLFLYISHFVHVSLFLYVSIYNVAVLGMCVALCISVGSPPPLSGYLFIFVFIYNVAVLSVRVALCISICLFLRCQLIYICLFACRLHHGGVNSPPPPQAVFEWLFAAKMSGVACVCVCRVCVLCTSNVCVFIKWTCVCV